MHGSVGTLCSPATFATRPTDWRRLQAGLCRYRFTGLGLSPKDLGGTPVCLYLCVDDVNGAFNRAVAAGSKIVDPLADREWGDRPGGVQDPFGFVWFIATPLKGN